MVFLVLEAFEISCVRQLRQTEVQNLGFAPMGDENVRRLDVTMDDAFFVSCSQTHARFESRGSTIRRSQTALPLRLSGHAGFALQQ